VRLREFVLGLMHVVRVLLPARGDTAA